MVKSPCCHLTLSNDTNIYTFFFEVYKLSKGTLVAKLANGKDSTLTYVRTMSADRLDEEMPVIKEVQRHGWEMGGGKSMRIAGYI